MCVGTCSGVTSAGIVISSALLGTSSAYSSLTSDSMREVLPTPRSPINSILTLRRGATGRCTMLHAARQPKLSALRTLARSLARSLAPNSSRNAAAPFSCGAADRRRASTAARYLTYTRRRRASTRREREREKDRRDYPFRLLVSYARHDE